MLKTVKNTIAQRKRDRACAWIKKNELEAVYALKNKLVYQMYSSGVSFGMINKWLIGTHQEPIRAYVMNKDKPVVVYGALTVERRKELEAMTGNKVVMVA